MSKHRTALVLGANGQDGSYLSEILCARGQDVVAVGRQPQPRWPVASKHYRYLACDIAEIDSLEALLRETSPAITYHFAAVHGSAGFDYESVWRRAHLVNTLSAHAVLDHIRRDNPAGGLVYASSAKVFGTPLPAKIDENTSRVSTCIYSTTKNAVHGLIEYYRARHRVAASALYLFNHESPRRDASYFIPRVANALASAVLGDKTRSSIHSLDFACDWGDAREYMEIAADIGERGLGEDYVLATGKTWTGREMVRAFFERHGLDYEAHIAPAVSGQAPSLYQASNARLVHRLGRAPQRDILDVLQDILRQKTAP